MRRRRTVKEMMFRTEPWSVTGMSESLRSTFNALQKTLFPTPRTPVMRKTTIDLDQARALYFNTNSNFSNGAHVCKPIIDVTADFMGLPSYNTGDENIDAILRDCVMRYWKSQLWEIYKLTMRDADCWVRIRGMPVNMLTTEQEMQRVHLEPIVTERVTPIYDPFTMELIEVQVNNVVFVPDESDNQVITTTNLQNGFIPGSRRSGRDHEIIEVISADEFRYFDITDGLELENLRTTNEWGFVNFVQFFNEYDSALEGGVSDLENVFPFIPALHDVMVQSRAANKLHAVPKVKFKISDIMTFITNNFPTAIDSNGNFTGQIEWSGKEILFMETPDEDAEFLEVKSSLGDSISLMEFIIDCIAIASERPEWAFMRNRSGETQSSTNPQTLPFKKLITRKRENAEEPLMMIGKMALAAYGFPPLRAEISWPEVEAADLVARADALSRATAAAEIANRANVISRRTYRQTIRPFYPAMKENDAEEQDALRETEEEQQRNLEIARAEAEIKQSAATRNGGPNSVRNRLPIDVIPPGD